MDFCEIRSNLIESAVKDSSEDFIENIQKYYGILNQDKENHLKWVDTLSGYSPLDDSLENKSLFFHVLSIDNAKIKIEKIINLIRYGVLLSFDEVSDFDAKNRIDSLFMFLSSRKCSRVKSCVKLFRAIISQTEGNISEDLGLSKRYQGNLFSYLKGNFKKVSYHLIRNRSYKLFKHLLATYHSLGYSLIEEDHKDPYSCASFRSDVLELVLSEMGLVRDFLKKHKYINGNLFVEDPIYKISCLSNCTYRKKMKISNKILENIDSKNKKNIFRDYFYLLKIRDYILNGIGIYYIKPLVDNKEYRKLYWCVMYFRGFDDFGLDAFSGKSAAFYSAKIDNRYLLSLLSE